MKGKMDSYFLNITKTSIALSAVAASLAVILYVTYVYTFWKRKGVCYMPPSFPFGNMKPVFLRQENFSHYLGSIYRYFKTRNKPFGGFYMLLKPEILLIDPKLIRMVLIKDFEYFENRGLYYNEKYDPLTANLLTLHTEKWRSLRQTLSPTFTSSKMKMMFHIMLAVVHELDNILDEAVQKGESLDIKDIMLRFSTDVIGSCAFGIECNSLRNPDCDFRKYGSELNSPKGLMNNVRLYIAYLMVDFAKFLNLRVFRKALTKFFLTTVEEIMKYREENNVVRNDFMNLLMQIKNTGTVQDGTTSEHSATTLSGYQRGLTTEEIAAQCYLFFVAGFDTSSATLTFTLFELAQNADIQEKLRQEIKTVLKQHDDNVTYEAIMEMNYLDQVVYETSRKYPLFSVIRECSRDYTIPNSRCTLKKGQIVRISTFGIHSDPEYYPQPQKYDPERFNEEEKAKRPSCTFLGFGDGPRNCIGKRFALIQIKVALTTLLRKYRFSVNKRTEFTSAYDPVSILLATKGKIWLDAEKC